MINRMSELSVRNFFTVVAVCAVAVLLVQCKDDNDGSGPLLDLPQISVEDVTVQEGDQDQVIELQVNLTGDNTTNAIVSFAAVPGTAESPDDYKVLTSGKLQFAPGETQKTIEVRITSDEGKEPVESFQLKFYGPLNVGLVKDNIIITIEDDDDNVAGLAIPSGGATSPEQYPGYNLIWRDEFVGDVLNTVDWTYEIGNGCPNNCGWGNNELEYYRQENTSIVNGHLVITAKKQNFAGHDYTSSRLITKGKQQFKFGRIDIRAALPEGKGIWPALWMLGSNIDAVGWPSCGEIDIMEMTGDVPNRVVGTVHYGTNLAQHQYNSVSKFVSSGDSYQEKFHVYSINWENNLIEFLVDDVVYHTITPADLNGQPYPFNKFFFFTMNLAVGGAWPGNPDSSTKFPQYLIVDYIRVFQK
ncbi:MAG: family 16 glycosylhydrolase [Bacteroidota bacterium]|nr:family 16 glycosylhydrolase [Bacteroidota bacterium]